MKGLGVEVIVFPPHLTNIINLFPKSFFRALKSIFQKLKGKFIKRNRHRAPTPADFVSFSTGAYVEAIIPRSILWCFKACGIVLFRLDTSVTHCPKERLCMCHINPPVNFCNISHICGENGDIAKQKLIR